MPFSGQDQIFAEAVTRLRAAAEEDRTFDAAQMQLINLPEIIRNAGPHWQRLKDKIRTGSVAFLKGCLGDNDIVLPAGDGFLIIFAEGDAGTLEQRALEMRHLLLEFYLGEEELKRLHISVTHRELNSRDLKALATAPAPKAARTPAPTHASAFAPIWSAQAQMVASYQCVPSHAGAPRYGYDKHFAETGALEHRDFLELDLGLLDVVEAAMGRYDVEEARPVIGISVHSTTLQNRTARGAFLERLARIKPEHLKHAFVRIAEIEAGAPLINLADWAGLLRARVKNIALEFHASEKVAPNLAQVGVWGAGYVLPPGAETAPDIVAQVRQFRRWGEGLTRQRLRFILGQVDQPGLIRLAAQAGAAFMTSPHFWPYEQWPGAIISAPPPQAAAHSSSGPQAPNSLLASG
jgi:hypothetical protein